MVGERQSKVGKREKEGGGGAGVGVTGIQGYEASVLSCCLRWVQA